MKTRLAKYVYPRANPQPISLGYFIRRTNEKWLGETSPQNHRQRFPEKRYQRIQGVYNIAVVGR